MNKYHYGVLVVLVYIVLAIFNDVDFGIILLSAISALAILAWIKNLSSVKIEKKVPDKIEEELFTGEAGQEFHDDFSKVPAGGADQIQPPPRSIGYGYGDGGKSTYDDLERIGIDTSKVKKD